MNVKELIEKLQTLDPNMKVWVEVTTDGWTEGTDEIDVTVEDDYVTLGN